MWMARLAVAGLCGIFAGKALARYVEGAYLVGDKNQRPHAPLRIETRGKNTDEIIRRNVFCSGCAPEPVDPDRIAKTTLPLELISTMVCPSDDAWSMAVIRDLSTRERDAQMLNRGRAIFKTNAVVVKVNSNRVYLYRDNKYEYLDLDASTVSTVNRSVDRSVVESLLANPVALLNDARFFPSTKGFKVSTIRPGSLFDKLGLQNGDTVKSINGLSVSIDRRGDNVTLDYIIRQTR
jgi:type II secretory pathway component PulC